MLTETLEGVQTTHAQELLVRSTSIDVLKVLIPTTEKKANDLGCEREGAKARLQQLQSGQQRYQAAVFPVQSENAAPEVALV